MHLKKNYSVKMLIVCRHKAWFYAENAVLSFRRGREREWCASNAISCMNYQLISDRIS